MLGEYFPIIVFIGVGVFFGLAPIVIGLILGPNRGYKQKNSTYECGFDSFRNSRLPFDVRFYLVAILFILFDLEVAFLVPWAVVFRKLGWFGMLSMLIFILLLLVGFVYEWKKGALEWE